MRLTALGGVGAYPTAEAGCSRYMRRVGSLLLALAVATGLVSSCSKAGKAADRGSALCRPAPLAPLRHSKAEKAAPPVAPIVCFAVQAEGLLNRSPEAQFATFRVAPASEVVLNVTMSVSPETVIRRIWLGIGHGHDGWGPDGPIHQHPILLQRAGTFGPGDHRFEVTWKAPSQISAMTSLTVTVTGKFGMLGNEIAFIKPND
jgi:hypothetical protein